MHPRNCQDRQPFPAWRGSQELLALFCTLGLGLAAAACSEPSSPSAATNAEAETPAGVDVTPPRASFAATAILQSHADYQVAGNVRLQQSGEEVTVTAELRGLPPGEHGFHIHEHGDCADPQFESAGSHFDPRAQPHGGPGDEQRHAGDLGNLTADTAGDATYTVRSTRISLDGGENSVAGRAVVVHLQPDHFDVQPDGGAGARIACGVIQLDP